MSKIFKIFSIFAFLMLLVSCGYKKIEQNFSDINILNIKINSKDRIAYSLRNNILLISNKESKNKYDITINFSKKKTSKVKNSAGKTTRYNVNINMGMTFKNINNLNTFSKSFVGSGDYDVLTGHAETINNEKNAYKAIVNQISDDIKNFIKFSLKNK
jgi:hypothetical protein|tara:strand:+ start:305 stop:778 length:474 start_codon:yes stop_codon:yes gene_type:complete